MSPSIDSGNRELALLDAARGGDEAAFRHLVEPHGSALEAHCYRMLGSLHDAQDARQETLLRAWRSLSGFESGQPIRPWLYRIATNACLDLIARRRPRVLTIDGRPPADPGDGPGRPLLESTWLDPFPAAELGTLQAGPEALYEQRESVELAFVAALQHLPPRQRAVLVLRAVLGFSAREVAEILATSVASVNSALQRARAAVEGRVPAQSQQQTLQSLGDAALRELVEAYVAAWQDHDIEAIKELLAADAIFAMPPHPNWWRGRRAVTALIASAGPQRLRYVLTSANAQPAIGWYRWERESEVYEASSLEVLTIDERRIAGITAFVVPTLFSAFGLPERLSD